MLTEIHFEYTFRILKFTPDWVLEFICEYLVVKIVIFASQIKSSATEDSKI